MCVVSLTFLVLISLLLWIMVLVALLTFCVKCATKAHMDGGNFKGQRVVGWYNLATWIGGNGSVHLMRKAKIFILTTVFYILKNSLWTYRLPDCFSQRNILLLEDSKMYEVEEWGPKMHKSISNTYILGQESCFKLPTLLER